MKVYNIYNNEEKNLGSFLDDRGTITDIFYQKSMNHGCIINNNPGAVRGNHYHNHTTQYTYILSGTLRYYASDLDRTQIKHHDAVAGDFIISEPKEIHAMKAGADGCLFIAFAEGPRGGEDYEKDTIRVESIVND
jgi:dTDP-4-dehydrorhamnose 3,5-epimerase-like enzyme